MLFFVRLVFPTTSICLVAKVVYLYAIYEQSFEAYCMYYKQGNQHAFDRNSRVVNKLPRMFICLSNNGMLHFILSDTQST